MEPGWKAGFAGPRAKRDAEFAPLPCPKWLISWSLLQRRAVTVPEAEQTSEDAMLLFPKRVKGPPGRLQAYNNAC